jgi:acyl-coenzyme A synthetase/AMP-(fatty) acid ligase
VEAVLAGLPSVADVAVAGEADAEWGQRVVAYVVPSDAGSPPRLEQLRAAVREVLPAHCAPRALVLLDEVPRTALGKIRRAELGSSAPLPS